MSEQFVQIKSTGELLNVRYIFSIAKTNFDETLGESPSWGIRLIFDNGEQRTVNFRSEENRNMAYMTLIRRLTVIKLLEVKKNVPK